MAACHNDNFDFNRAFSVSLLCVSSICILYIITDYTKNSNARRNPGRLMLSRAIFDYLAVLLVIYSIRSPHISCESASRNSKICPFWGGAFLFFLYVPAIYYTSICWQLFIILRNPFRAPSSSSILYHFGVWLVCFFITLFVATVGNNGDGQFEYRTSFQICFLKQRQNINLWNVFVVYIPIAFIVLGGIFANSWSIKQLRRRVVDETFKLRWVTIKQQTAIITLFTVNYTLQGIIWMIIFNDTENTPKYDPYILSIFCTLAILFDAITWCIRNKIQTKYSTQDHKFQQTEMLKMAKKNKQKIKAKIPNNISDALRKEVITFITAGLAQSATLNSSKNVKRRRKKSSMDQRDESIRKRTQNGDEDENCKKIGHFSKIFLPNVMTNYFLLSDEEEKSEQSQYELHTAVEPAPLFMDDQNVYNNSDILSDRYYPTKIDGKLKAHLIESYPIGSVGAEQTNVVFTDYAPVIFGYLRRNVFGVSDDEYRQSILPMDDVSKVSLELIAKFSEGRSGAFFFFTKDQKYLIKTLTKSEAQLLIVTLKKYALFMTNNKESYLSRYFGLHSIKLYSHSIYFVVNKNVFPPLYKSADEVYDIKGSWIDRHTNHHVNEHKLMKDEDLHSTLVLNEAQSIAMNEQLRLDSEFLSSVNIMDYSLLLGIYYTKINIDRNGKYKSVVHIDGNEEEEEENGNEEKEDNELNDYSLYNASYVEGPGRYCIGIIDMLQEWDLNKKTERFIKGLRGKDRNGVSCVPPGQYQQRFMDKMFEIGIGIDEKETNQDGDAGGQYTV